MRLRSFTGILVWSITIIIVLFGAIYILAWKSPAYYTASRQYDPITDSIVPFKDYSSIFDHPRPFIIKRNNQYCIFGAAHTRNRHSPEIRQVQQEWDSLKPSIALVEGRLGFLMPGIMDPVTNLGEGGKLKELAERDNVPLFNWDLPKEILAKKLLGKFNAEQIALAQILNPYFSELRFGRPSSPEKFVKEFIHRAKYVGQEDNIKTVADIDRVWIKYFDNGQDWRNVNDQEGLPGYLNELAAYTNDIRNQQLVTTIKELLLKGEKPFLICGSSHAACIAPAFRE